MRPNKSDPLMLHLSYEMYRLPYSRPLGKTTIEVRTFKLTKLHFSSNSNENLRRSMPFTCGRKQSSRCDSRHYFRNAELQQREDCLMRSMTPLRLMWSGVLLKKASGFSKETLENSSNSLRSMAWVVEKS
ncbi:hypothetical protein PILCRDRAFT_418312 [Piloderma croceum F 1598]|uniref:Uncharacterized protein n=1 Tax=Piloderma croceum (strain F 1598) TaxID=765440 RepID=A0A0C3FWN4_PILCF|nr:hypothetical protein PILCRDRAFT_418312 [Piloderma croceum F 1598]